jgi:hypothetical protein
MLVIRQHRNSVHGRRVRSTSPAMSAIRAGTSPRRAPRLMRHRPYNCAAFCDIHSTLDNAKDTEQPENSYAA